VPRQIEHPVVVPDTTDRTRTKHPAYALIGAGRVSCGGAGGGISLYGSDFKHNDYVRITIRRSQLGRGLSHDYFYGSGEQLIEVALSYSQWAEFVSSMNMGEGIACTLQHVAGQQVPQLPPPPKRDEQFITEQQKDMDALIALVADAEKQVAELNISQKAKTVMLNLAFKIKQELKDNLPFVMKSFGKHLEDTVEKAKTEVNAYVENKIHRAGLAAMGAAVNKLNDDNNPPILMIDGDTETSK
jgi:hypothetical protein